MLNYIQLYYFTILSPQLVANPKNFTGVSFNQIPIIEELIYKTFSSMILTVKMVTFLVNLFDGVERYDENIKLLRYNNHICYFNDINKFFTKFCCFSCDHFNRYLKTCKERVKYVYPRSAYSLRKTVYLETWQLFNRLSRRLYPLQNFCRLRLQSKVCSTSGNQ